MGRTIRIFISSTFKYFDKIRNELIGEVLPEIRDLCSRNGFAVLSSSCCYIINYYYTNYTLFTLICTYLICQKADKCDSFLCFFQYAPQKHRAVALSNSVFQLVRCSEAACAKDKESSAVILGFL